MADPYASFSQVIEPMADPYAAFSSLAPNGQQSTMPPTESGRGSPARERRLQNESYTYDPETGQRIPMDTFNQRFVGAGAAAGSLHPEVVLSGITAGAGSLADTVTGSDPGAHDWAYRPRTSSGLAAAENVNTAFSPMFAPRPTDGPLAQTLKERIPQFLGAAGTVTGAAALARGVPVVANRLKPAPLLTPEEALTRQTMKATESQSAAAAAPDITASSPELRQAVSVAGKKGNINVPALRRQVQADSLPIKIQLTEGQASGNLSKLSNEQNMRGAQPRLAEHFQQQNQKLIENLQLIRDRVGPDVFTTNPVEHGDALIQAYKAIDDAAEADISAKYKALADANGGDLPVDGQAFLKQASANLKRENKAHFLPPEIKKTLSDITKGRKVQTDPLTFEKTYSSGMTFGQFENLRTTLAAASRAAERAGNGNAVAAIKLVRDALESIPMGDGAARLKPLADAARSAARARFERLREDPAYNAAVNDKVSADRFVQRFIISGAKDKLEIMRRNLGNDPVALQTMAVGAFDHLRNGARISPEFNGNFTQAGFAKALQQLDPKASILFDPAMRETLMNLRDVAQYTQFQPRGSFVNNSNTFVAGAASAAAQGAEGAANVAAHGIPVGTWTRKGFQNMRSRREVNRILAPGAGINE